MDDDEIIRELMSVCIPSLSRGPNQEEAEAFLLLYRKMKEIEESRYRTLREWMDSL